jgi:hypothetical protein
MEKDAENTTWTKGQVGWRSVQFRLVLSLLPRPHYLGKSETRYWEVLVRLARFENRFHHQFPRESRTTTEIVA